MAIARTGSIQYGAMQAVRNCTRVQRGEYVVIITDRETIKIADAIAREAQKVPARAVQVFVMEDFGERPEDGSKPLAFPAEMAEALATADVSFYAAVGRKGELKSFRSPMLDCVEANPKLRHGHMPGVNAQIMETGMSVDYDQVQKLSAKLAEICRPARSIRVTTPAGTDFTVQLHPDWRWKISDGLIRAEDWSNLPDGEIFTCAWKIDQGRIVVDGVLGDYFSEKFGLLEANPVTLEIRDSRVAKMHCDRQDLLAELEEALRAEPNSNRVGEFAIGTNVGLEGLIGNMLQDEKFPGVHVALGSGYPEKTGADWTSETHIDAVLRRTTIVVDGHRTVMQDGRFTLD